MIASTKNPWTSFLWSALTMSLTVIIVLVVARTQLHDEVIDSDARFLKTIFEKNLEESYLENLESEFFFEETEIINNHFMEFETQLNQAAVACLNIPHIQGIEAYNHEFIAQDLSTSVSNSTPERKEFLDAMSEGWSCRNLPGKSLAILVHLHHDEQLIFIEFSVLPSSYEKSWSEIDTTLTKLGLLIGLTMLLILWIIFKIMISRISAKENLLVERTEVLQKTNEELSRAYKTTSLGAITGHLMHGLRGQLTNLQNVVSKDQNVQQQISKIQQLVQQSLGSIKEAKDGQITYSLSLGELFEVIQKKFCQLDPEVAFDVDQTEGLRETINNLQANLALAILTNLVQNAIDARNGVCISLSCRKSEGFLEIDISDNGSGIPPEIKNRLFEPVVSKKGGSGIGLALSQQLAESMGAKLTLMNSDRRGTSFRLSIPLA